MLRYFGEFGTLTYTFAESVAAMYPYYVMRAVGGLIYWAGGAVMLYNVIMTIRMASAEKSAAAPATATA